ncbi:MAG: hypothetical protein MUC49_13030 [Raineya sp.]|jgi:hypothetical protein|nr:hypothetical protein [Raineya sp.]
MELDKKTLIGLGVVIVLIIAVFAYLAYDKKKKAKAKAEIDAQISSGQNTLSGQVTAGVKPDDSYDATADVQRILNAKGYINDDEEAIYDTIRKLGTRSRLVKLRTEFMRVEGKELDAWLASKVFNDSEMATYNNLIQSLK